jgi:hypothetical protein
MISRNSSSVHSIFLSMADTMNAKTPKPDDVLRTLLNTPPDPRGKKAKPKKRKKSK